MALDFIFFHIMTILNSKTCLFLFATIPIYHLIVKINTTHILQTSIKRIHKIISLKQVSRAIVSIGGSIDILKPIDTQVCLLPEKPTDMVSGLTNTGNSCFLNSVLQALSSLPQLQSFLDHSTKKTNKNLPLTRSLLKTLRLLSTPVNKNFKPIDVVNALDNKRVINRQQQDAQELYQLLVSQLEDETDKIQSNEPDSQKTDENPLNGILSYQVSCSHCGYNSGLLNQKFNNIQLNLPSDTESTTLEECLSQLTHIEELSEVECIQCSVFKTIEQLDPIQDRQKIQELRQKLKGDMIKPTDLTTRVQTQKTKVAMVAQPPSVLCLHFVRSLFSSTGEVMKNGCRVHFPDQLDLSPYCSRPARYRLMSTIVHYGDHQGGHYVCYKRKISADQCDCNRCRQGSNRLTADDDAWFRISDDRVTPCQTHHALEENPFMLLYEELPVSVCQPIFKPKRKPLHHIQPLTLTSHFQSIPIMTQ